MNKLQTTLSAAFLTLASATPTFAEESNVTIGEPVDPTPKQICDVVKIQIGIIDANLKLTTDEAIAPQDLLKKQREEWQSIHDEFCLG